MTDPLPDSVRVDGPFPEVRVRPRPRWWERLRALVGASVLVLVMALFVAALVAVAILTLAILVVSSFS